MPKTSICPNCREAIALADVSPDSLVECPLCRSQFELKETLDSAVETDENAEALPPEVGVVGLQQSDSGLEASEKPDQPDFAELAEIEAEAEQEKSEDDESEDDESEDDESEDDESEDDESEDDELVLVEEGPVQARCPCCHESFALKDLLLAETDEPIGVEAASAILADGSIRESEPTEGMRFSFGGDPEVDHSDFRLESVESGPSTPAGAFEFAAPVGANGEQGETSETARARRRRRDQGGAKDLLGAIFGGAAGLLITYYCLNLFGGARFDWFHVYLPGVKHTTQFRPGWLGGPPQDEFDSGISDGLGMEEELPEPAPSPAKAKPATSPKIEEATKGPDDVASPEPPASEEAALPADYVGLLEPPQVTSEEMGKALRELSRLQKAGPLTEEGYELWCQVAKAVTFIDRLDGDPQTQGRIDNMRILLFKLTIEDAVTIGELATKRALAPERANHGILLVGTAHNPNTPKGKGFITGLVVAQTGARVVIASDRKLPIRPDDRIVVLGYLVDQPKEAIQGLETELPQVVWVRTVVKFGK